MEYEECDRCYLPDLDATKPMHVTTVRDLGGGVVATFRRCRGCARRENLQAAWRFISADREKTAVND